MGDLSGISMAEVDNASKISGISTLSTGADRSDSSPKKVSQSRTPSVQRSMVREETERLLELEQRDKMKLENQVNMYFEELKSLKSCNSALQLQLEQDKNVTDQLTRQYQARLEIYKTTALEREETYEELYEENMANMEEVKEYEQLSEELHGKLSHLSTKIEQLSSDLQQRAIEVEEKDEQNDQLKEIAEDKEKRISVLEYEEEMVKEAVSFLENEKRELSAKILIEESEFKVKRRAGKRYIYTVICVFAMACCAGAAALF